MKKEKKHIKFLVTRAHMFNSKGGDESDRMIETPPIIV